jgi:2-C-methyl-D-erythritol 4-phosphate cytidylyltransferase
MTLWCVVPAGGAGRRMGASVPKQYLALEGRPVLGHALDVLCALQPEAIALVVAADDLHVDRCALPAPVEVVRRGGRERAETVLAGLRHLSSRAADDDPVLVHDAARPCVTVALVQALLDAAGDQPDGGLLALPVSETVKRAGPSGAGGPARVRETCERDGLWLAQTPQVFPFGRLLAALERALDAGLSVTDEASAIEASGGAPLLVEGAACNLKITRPDDLVLARYWLEQLRSGTVTR